MIDIRLSKSKVFAYRQCPYRYKRVTLDGWKPEHIPKQLAKGIEIHEVLESAYEYDTPMLWTRSSKIQEHENYEKYKEDVENFLKWEAERDLPLYIEEKFYDKDLNFSGIVDRIDIDKDGKTCLIDYKSGKGKKYISAYADELLMYVHLAEKCLKITIDKIGIFFTSSGRYIETDVDRERMKKAVQKITDTREQILKRLETNDWPKANSPLCSWCSLYQNKACEGEDDIFDEVIGE